MWEGKNAREKQWKLPKFSRSLSLPPTTTPAQALISNLSAVGAFCDQINPWNQTWLPLPDLQVQPVRVCSKPWEQNPFNRVQQSPHHPELISHLLRILLSANDFSVVWSARVLHPDQHHLIGWQLCPSSSHKVLKMDRLLFCYLKL